MVALNEQFHHNGTQPRLQGTGYGLQRGGEFVEVFSDHGPMTTDQKSDSPDGLFIDPCSLIFERRAGANDIIYCGYPDNKRVSTDIGTGLNDPEAELYYVRNRSYNSIPGTVLRQEPKSRQATGVATRVLQRDPIGYAGGVNFYEYVGGRASAVLDTTGLTAIPTTVPGLLASLLPGRGVFHGTLNDTATAFTVGSFLSLSFSPSDLGRKCCREIEFIQFIQEAKCFFGPGLYCHDTGGWVIDDTPYPGQAARVPPPFYPYQFPWTRPAGKPTFPGTAMMTDNPSFPRLFFATYYTFLSQIFATFAVCTRGKEAGHAYGEELWGHVFHLVQWFDNPFGHSTVTRMLEGAVPPAMTGSLSESMELRTQ